MPKPPINKNVDRPKIHTAHLHLRVRPDQPETWKAAAARKGLEFSEWVRDTLDREARKK